VEGLLIQPSASKSFRLAVLLILLWDDAGHECKNYFLFLFEAVGPGVGMIVWPADDAVFRVNALQPLSLGINGKAFCEVIGSK
jgi:hypothetical protein